MGFRLFKRIGILPGVTLNLSKSGVSLSAGPRGAKVTVGTSGARATVGVPGTGLSYTHKFGTGPGRRPKRDPSDPPAEPATRTRLELSAWDRLRLPNDEIAFCDGLLAYVSGDRAQAAGLLGPLTGLADAQFLAGVLRADTDPAEALAALDRAVAHSDAETGLGALFVKYEADVTARIAITPSITATIAPERTGALLLAVEMAQRLGQWSAAVERAREALAAAELSESLRGERTNFARLSLADVLLEQPAPTVDDLREVIRLAEGCRLASVAETALLACQAEALQRLGKPDAALTVWNAVFGYVNRRFKLAGGEALTDLVCEVRFHRATLYRESGQAGRARADFEAVFAMNPAYPGVRAALGLPG
jgi:tetratricopeptide (TPR) repeat protein